MAAESSMSRLDRLYARLAEIYTEIDEIYFDDVASWQFTVGRVHVAKRMNSMSWAKSFVMICVLAFLGGAVLTFIKPTKDLGIALVAGSILAVASFASQVWATQVQREHVMKREVNGSEMSRRIQELNREARSLWKKVEKIEKAEGSR